LAVWIHIGIDSIVIGASLQLIRTAQGGQLWGCRNFLEGEKIFSCKTQEKCAVSLRRNDNVP
jgi:hypothetical protein